jgi:hypothetical protein
MDIHPPSLNMGLRRTGGWTRIFKRQKTAEKAGALAEKSGEQNLLQKNQELLALDHAHQPDHEPLEKLVPAAP